MDTDLPYRPCAGVVLTNADGLIFIGERSDRPGEWQMPQGGIDKGEDPAAAALRELTEETGVPADRVTLEAEHPDWVRYDLPKGLLGKVLGGRYRGQTQKWFLMRLSGDDAIDLDAAKDDEFTRWRWATADEVLDAIVDFKRPVYGAVLAAFRDRLA